MVTIGERRRHILKVQSKYFTPLRKRLKTFEIRKNDRDYQVGDILILKAFDELGFTGDVLRVEATYISDFEQKDGYVVIAIKPYN